MCSKQSVYSATKISVMTHKRKQQVQQKQLRNSSQVKVLLTFSNAVSLIVKNIL